MILNGVSSRGSGRREEERSRRRLHILRAAERVFGRHPFHEATMQAVAAEAELGMQGVYEHFSSKQALYEAVILHRARAFERRLEEALEGLDDPLEQLAAVARVRVEVFVEAPAFLPVFLAELIRFDWGVESRLSPEVHGVFRQVRDRVDGIIARAVDAGELRSVSRYFLQHVFMDVINAVLRTTAPDRARKDIERCVDLVMQTYLRGVAASRS